MKPHGQFQMFLGSAATRYAERQEEKRKAADRKRHLRLKPKAAAAAS